MNFSRRQTPSFGAGDASPTPPQFGDANLTPTPKYVGTQGDANVTPGLLPDLTNYTLTVGEATSIMLQARCKHASNRKIQRLCKEGSLDCYKLSTTRDGPPVAEWLVNETSLQIRIKEIEPKIEDGDDTATPPQSGDANYPRKPEFKPDDLATPKENGVAIPEAGEAKELEETGDDIPTPDLGGDANGETRSIASVLIENAKLTAELEGRDVLIDELRDDKKFMREELTDARAGRGDVTQIAEKMLKTLETIAGRREQIPEPQTDAFKEAETVKVHPIETEEGTK